MKKQQMEIALIVLLIILMYLQSSLLNTFSKSVLGKGIMIFAIVYITQKFGKNAGILSALIMVLNLHNAKVLEGAALARNLGAQEPDYPHGHRADGTETPPGDPTAVVQEGFRESQKEAKDTKAAKATKNSQITKRAQELAKKSPAGDLQAYVDEGDQDGLPDPETWMSKESLAKFKAYVKKIKKKRDAQVTTQALAVDEDEDEEKEKEAFINMMLAPKSIQGIDRQLKKVAEYNKMAVTSQGNEFAAGKFGYVKRPF